MWIEHLRLFAGSAFLLAAVVGFMLQLTFGCSEREW
jgi:hypothetical protein